jgi:hypothetical protein
MEGVFVALKWQRRRDEQAKKHGVDSRDRCFS